MSSAFTEKHVRLAPLNPLKSVILHASVTAMYKHEMLNPLRNTGQETVSPEEKYVSSMRQRDHIHRASLKPARTQFTTDSWD